MDPWCTSCRDHWETPVEIIMNSPAPTEFDQHEGVECDIELTNIGESEHDQGSERSASSGLKILKGSTKVIVDPGSDGGGISGGGNGEGGSIGAAIEIPPVNGDQTSLNGGDQQLNDTGPSLLHEYLRLLYCFGIGAYESDVPAMTNGCQNVLHIVRRIAFATLAFLSLFQALNEIKDLTYGDARVDHVFGYVSIAYFVSTLVVLMLYFQVIVFNHPKLNEMLKSVSYASSRYNGYPKVLSALPVILGTISVVDGLAKAMFEGVDITGWSLELVVRTKSYRLRRAVALWSNASLENDTLDEYFQEQAATLTLSNIVVGGFSMCAEFSYILQLSICTHLFLILSLSLYLTSSQLQFQLQEKGLLEFISSNIKISCNEEKVIWRKYQETLRVSSTVEISCGTFFRGIHIYLLLSFGHFFWITVYFTVEPSLSYWLLPIRLMLALVAYYFAIQSARKHESFRDWVTQNYSEKDAVIVLHDRRIDKIFVLEDLSSHRIGIGSNLFYINDEFALKFISVVASYFVFISDRATN